MIATALVAAYATAIGWIISTDNDRAPHGTDSSEQEAIAAFIIPAAAAPYSVPLPAARLRVPTPMFSAPTQIQLVDPDADLVEGVVGSISVPRLSASQDADPRIFAQRAELAPGESVTVVLSVEVRADGAPGKVIIAASSGNPIVDQQAIGYALALHWIPGSVNRHASTMRIQFPVTLTAGAPSKMTGPEV